MNRQHVTSVHVRIEKNILFYYFFHEILIRAKLSIRQTVAGQSVTDIRTLVPFRDSAFNGPRGEIQPVAIL